MKPVGFLNFLHVLAQVVLKRRQGITTNYMLRNTPEGRRSLLLRGGNLKSRKILGNRKIILKWIIRKFTERMWTGLKWVRTGAGGEFLD